MINSKNGARIALLFAIIMFITFIVVVKSSISLYPPDIRNVDSLVGYIVIDKSRCSGCDGHINYVIKMQFRSPSNDIVEFTVNNYDYYSYDMGDTIGVTKRKKVPAYGN